MLEQIGSIYRDSWRAALLFPVLFLIPALVEFAQHGIEVNTGLYGSVASAKAVIDHQVQTAMRFAIVLASALPGYWFVRFLAFRDAPRAAKVEQLAFALWLVVAAFTLVQTALLEFAPPLGMMLGLTGNAGFAAEGVATLFSLILVVYLTAWTVAWPLGNRMIGPLQSLRIMFGSFWRTIGYALGCTLPLAVVHYGLDEIETRFTPPLLDWLVLALESLVTAWVACMSAGSAYLAARHAAGRKGINLMAEPA